jgi:hypothetical protein
MVSHAAYPGSSIDLQDTQPIPTFSEPHDKYAFYKAVADLAGVRLPVVYRLLEQGIEPQQPEVRERLQRVLSALNQAVYVVERGDRDARPALGARV